jgi:hypothetical protein
MFKAENRAIHLVAILSVVGVLSLLFATKWGIGISPDGLVYIAGARNLLLGRGYSEFTPTGELVPITHFPPLFSIMLALLGTVGIDLLEGARWLNALLFGANTLLVGILIYRSTGGSIWPSLFGSFLVLTSSNMLDTHSMALTEPAFIFFGFLGLSLLAAYIENLKPSLLVASSITIALAFLARYVGVALVVTGIIGLLVLARRTYYRRLLDCLVFGILSSLPMAVFVIRNHMVSGGASDMKMGFHPITFKHIGVGLDTVSCWLMPEAIPFTIRVSSLTAAAGLLAFLTLLLWSRRRSGGSDALKAKSMIHTLLIIFILVFCATLVFFISFFDHDINFISRVLLPVQASTIILVVCWVREIIRFAQRIRPLQVAFTVICIAFAVSYLVRGARLALIAHRDGKGFTSRAWRQSEILQKVRALPEGTRVYCNVPSVIYYLAGKPAFRIPIKFDLHTGSQNDRYQSELASLKEQLGSQRTVLVYLSNFSHGHLPSGDELKKALSLSLIETAVDGSIYELRAEKVA